MAEQEESFEKYEVTTVNPGLLLLFGTLFFCVLCFVLLGLITFRNRSSLREILFRHISSLNDNIFNGNEMQNEINSPSEQEEISMATTNQILIEEELEVDGELINVVTKRGKKKKEYPLTDSQTTTGSTLPLPEEDPQEGQHEMIEFEVEGDSINIVTALGRQGKKKYSLSRGNQNNQEEDDALTMDDFSPLVLFKNAYPPIESDEGEKKVNQVPSNLDPSRKQMMSEGLVTGETKKRKKKLWWQKAKSERNLLRKEPKGFSVRKETKKIINLAAPWSFTSFVSSGSSLVIIVMISHTLGVAEMIAYTYVWYIISILFVINRALYSSIFHHVNISVALETEDGDNLTGKYLQMSVLLNVAFATPVSIAAVFLIKPILTKIGYGEGVVNSCQIYAILATISNILESSLSIVSCVLDITGHARFNAVFDFWETIVTVLTVIFIMPLFEPSLISLGLIFLVQDLVMIGIFLFVTAIWKGWFRKYEKALFTPFYYSWNDSALLSVIRYTLPFIWDEVIGEFEWTVLAYFASYQGKAEAATWILLYYVWELSTIIPGNYGSAAAVRTAHHIAQGNIPAAKSIILRTFKIVVATTCISMTILFVFKKPLVSLLSPDETLTQMLVEIVPYLCLCEPFIAIGTVASSLNEGIGLYESSVAVYFWVTMIVTLPSAWIFTYHFHYNIEGLASSLCIGAVVYGVINVDIFMNKKIEAEQPVMKSPLADTDVVA